MSTENEQEITDNEQEVAENEWDETSDELLDLKRELAEEIIQKMQEKDSSFSSLIFEPLMINYLVDDDSIRDKMGDKGIEKFLSELTDKEVINKEVINELNWYRTQLNQADTKEKIESLKASIFNGSENSQSTSNTSEQTDTQSSNPAATTAAITTTTAAATTASTLWTSSTDEKAKVDSSESYEIDHLNITVSPESKKIWENLKWKEKPDLEPFACALKAYNLAKKQENIHNTKYLTVVDFTKKKWKKRFFVINLENNTVEHAVKVWHWKNTGGERATDFSNKSWSKQSSLWWYLLPDKITKSPNKSRSWLRQIKWLEDSNDQSDERWIAVHPWWENGSEGCFTLPKDISKTIMEKIAWSFLFAYAESKEYFAYQSKYFKQNPDGSIMA